MVVTPKELVDLADRLDRWNWPDAKDAADGLRRASFELHRTRAALLAYAKAHGNIDNLSHDDVEVAMFKCFLRAIRVLGIDQETIATSLATVGGTDDEAQSV